MLIVPFPTWIQDLSETFKMSDTNATRLPIAVLGIVIVIGNIAYVGDDVNPTLTRGDRWAQHPSNDVPIVLMPRCVLVFVEYLVR